MLALPIGESYKNLEVCAPNAVLESDAPIMVQLRSRMLHFLIKYFILNGNSHTEAKVKLDSKQIWCGIVE